MSRAQELIQTLDLQPHPEGGYYRETFRSSQMVETPDGPRSAGTAILYLLSGDEVSRFHRIDADEIWHFHEGAPLTIHQLQDGGVSRSDELSLDNPQIAIDPHVWFGASLDGPKTYCLVSCTVMPGFAFAGFELAEKDVLLDGWLDAASLIDRLT